MRRCSAAAGEISDRVSCITSAGHATNALSLVLSDSRSLQAGELNRVLHARCSVSLLLIFSGFNRDRTGTVEITASGTRIACGENR